MIAYVEGKIAERTPSYLVVDVNGVGYLLQISLNTYSKIPENGVVKVFTYLIVKEDSHTLFGFAEKAERELFEHLISVSGVGAGTARMILSSLTPVEVTAAIVNGSVPVLQKIKGIGGKTAQRIIIDLKDKLARVQLSQGIELTPVSSSREEALSALVMLGFARNAAEKALEKASATGSHSTEELVKHALKNL